jgi:pyruvate/2-oxoglutarate dehydrogenase complex dihydrolipoamide acyltransferase (E2) component
MAKMTLKLPKLGVSMQEGTITAWKVKDGDKIEVGDHLYDVESEKSTLEVDSPFAGTIRILADAGEALKVGDPVAEVHTN